MSQVPDSQLSSEEEYRNMFEAAGDGLVIYDIGLDSVVEANPRQVPYASGPSALGTLTT